MRRSCGPSSCVDDPHLKESGGLVPMQTDDGGTTDVVLLPLLLGGRRPGVRQPLPRVGEHTDEILARARRRRADLIRTSTATQQETNMTFAIQRRGLDRAACRQLALVAAHGAA